MARCLLIWQDQCWRDHAPSLLDSMPDPSVPDQLQVKCSPPSAKGGHCAEDNCDGCQIMSYAGHNTVNVLRASPGVDEPVVRNGAAAADASGAAVAADTIVVRGSDGGLDFGLGVSRSAPQTVWDATFSRPVNTSFTGADMCQHLPARAIMTK